MFILVEVCIKLNYGFFIQETKAAKEQKFNNRCSLSLGENADKIFQLGKILSETVLNF